MANLTSTAPLAFNTFYGYMVDQANAQSPAIQVFHTQLVGEEPDDYVILTGIENHRFEWAALGSFAFYEWYDLVGYATVWQGNTDEQTVLTNTYGLFQSVVQTAAVTNRAPPLSAALQSAGLLSFLPGDARYSGAQGEDDSGGPMGFAGRVDFVYHCYARVTV